MNLNSLHLLKEASYYKRLGKGHLTRVFIKFLLIKTPLSKMVNKKIYNFFYKGRVEKFTKEPNPTILQIENTNACNARCIMCPHNIMKRKQKVMGFEEFKKIVDEILPNYKNIKTLTITGFGEPLVDGGIIDKIEYSNKKYPHIGIDVFTNGSLLNKNMTEEFLKRDIRKINFSINAMENNYTKITGLDYKKVRENILYFVKRKKELGKKFPLINFSLMILKENEKDIKDFIKLWSSYGDSVMTYLPLDWTGDVKIETVGKPAFKKKRWSCIPLWQNITIDVDGNVIMCCQDYESKVRFGNVLKQPIKEIINSKKFRKIREMHKKGIYTMDVCRRCDNWINSSLWWWVYT